MFQNLTQANRKLRLQNQERLRELGRRRPGEVELICSHDSEQMDRAAVASVPNQRRTMTVLTPEARELLKSDALVHLVTLNPDGGPQLSCVWSGSTVTRS